MRIKITKDKETKWVKPQHLQRFLDKGWTQENPESEKRLDYSLEVSAEVVSPDDDEEDYDLEAPIISLPTEDNQEGDE